MVPINRRFQRTYFLTHHYFHRLNLRSLLSLTTPTMPTAKAAILFANTFFLEVLVFNLNHKFHEIVRQVCVRPWLHYSLLWRFVNLCLLCFRHLYLNPNYSCQSVLFIKLISWKISILSQFSLIYYSAAPVLCSKKWSTSVVLTLVAFDYVAHHVVCIFSSQKNQLSTQLFEI